MTEETFKRLRQALAHRDQEIAELRLEVARLKQHIVTVDRALEGVMRTNGIYDAEFIDKALIESGR